MEYYNVKETALKLGLSTRAIQKRCIKTDVRKINNKYQISDETINVWRVEIEKANEPTNEPTNQNKRTKAHLHLLIEELKKENTDLKEDLSQYEIEDNERLEVFTEENYNIFKNRLQEWDEQRLELKHKEELYKAETKSNKEITTHYRNLFEYQRKQNEKVLEMHQKLIDNIGLQLRHVSERNLIEAIEKKVVSPDTRRPE